MTLGSWMKRLSDWTGSCQKTSRAAALIRPGGERLVERLLLDRAPRAVLMKSHARLELRDLRRSDEALVAGTSGRWRVRKSDRFSTASRSPRSAPCSAKVASGR